MRKRCLMLHDRQNRFRHDFLFIFYGSGHDLSHGMVTISEFRSIHKIIGIK